MSSAGVAGELVCMLALADLSQQREEECLAESLCTFCLSLSAFVTNSLMNPIWMVKTRMQLEKKCVAPLAMIKVCTILHTSAVNPTSYNAYETLRGQQICVF